MTGLQISPALTLPIDAAVETFGILAKKGAGKSNAAVVMAEELHDAGVPWVAVDPKGDWWGVRSSADGTQPGLPVVVFGGKHGDLPLEPQAGASVADVILGDEERGYLSCVLDVSQFSLSDQRRFLLAFGERLFRQKDEERVLHLFLEEAHEYLPQQPGREMAHLVSVWQRIVKQGRFKGLGVTVVTQRSAALNKDVLTQVDSLVVLRTMSPQDRAAVKGWVEVHAGASDILKSLHELHSGEAWLWSPERLTEPARFQFRRRRTFDSGATPKVGEVRRAPATLADVDLAAIKEVMAESIEKAAADDPKLLRKRIADLERELTAERAKPPPEPVVERVEMPVLDSEIVDRLQHAIAPAYILMDVARDTLAAHQEWLGQQTSPARGSSRETPGSDRAEERGTGRAPRAAEPKHNRTPVRSATATPTGDTSIGKGERIVLTAIAQYDQGVTREQLTVLTGYKRSTRDAYIQRLSQAGLADAPKGGRITATAAAFDVLGDDFEPLPTGAALREHWLTPGTLPEGERLILHHLIDAYPAALDRDYLSDATGYKRSTRDAYLQRLRARQLVTTDGSPRAVDTLFEPQT